MNYRKISFLAILMFLITSCSSDSDYSPVDTPTTTQKVEISISNFKEQDGGQLRSTSSEDTDKPSYLVIYFLESGGKIFTKQIYEKAPLPDKISAELTKGKYTILAYASNNPITGGILSHGGVYNKPQDLSSYLMEGTLDLTIDNQDITASITLKHIYTRIEIALNDFAKMPENIKSIVPMFYLSYDDNSEGKTEIAYNAIRPDIYSNDITSKYYTVSSIEPISGTENSLIWYQSDYKPVLKLRSDYLTISEDKPLIAYFIPNKDTDVRANTESQTKMPRLALFLLGYETEVPTLDACIFDNENVVFKKKISDDIKLSPGQAITYTGNMFANDGISVNIDNKWDENINEQEF